MACGARRRYPLKRSARGHFVNEGGTIVSSASSGVHIQEAGDDAVGLEAQVETWLRDQVTTAYDVVLADLEGMTVPAEEVFASIRTRHASRTAWPKTANGFWCSRKMLNL